MTPYIDLCLCLLTYKGKVLLLQQDNILPTPNHNAWHFINKLKGKNTTAEKTIIQEVHKETGISLESVQLLATIPTDDTTQYLFHARLSDKHVNNIQRAEGRILQFFGLKELSKLHIHPSTKLFFQENKEMIEALSSS